MEEKRLSLEEVIMLLDSKVQEIVKELPSVSSMYPIMFTPSMSDALVEEVIKQECAFAQLNALTTLKTRCKEMLNMYKKFGKEEQK